MPLFLNQEPKKTFAAQKTITDIRPTILSIFLEDIKDLEDLRILRWSMSLVNPNFWNEINFILDLLKITSRLYKIDNDNIIEWFLSNFEVYFMYQYYLY